ncbi:MAG TPA: phosphatase PAP2 family protein [Methylomirabilota bacterium]|nr:phosphatase PAP2 family protein [Methylomirabilota bacterium]
MSKKIFLILSGIGLFFIFIFFSFLVHKNLFTHFDFNMTVRFQDHISRRFDEVFSLLSDVGQFQVMLVVLLIVAGILFFRRKFLAATSALVLFVGFHVIELYGKFFVNHPPPPHFLLRTKQLIDFPQFYVRSEFSYPSGHAGRAAFLSTFLLIIVLSNKKFSPRFKAMLAALIIGYDLVMCISRIYLGEHWSSDVIGGTILGTALGLVSGSFLLGNHQKKPSV